MGSAAELYAGVGPVEFDKVSMVDIGMSLAIDFLVIRASVKSTRLTGVSVPHYV